MGTIQNSINSILGTAAVALGAGKKLVNDKAAAQLTATKEQQALIDESQSLESELADITAAEETGNEHVTNAEADFETAGQEVNAMQKRGNGTADSRTGKFISTAEIERRVHDLNVAEQALTAARDEVNAIAAQKDAFNKRMQAFNDKKDLMQPKIDKILGGKM